MSEIRKRYFFRLAARSILLIACIILWLTHSPVFQILEGMAFFERITVLHLLWIVWIIDMIQQVIPLKNKIALGSQKLFANRFRPVQTKVNATSLKNYITATTKAAYKVMVLWLFLLAAIGLCYYKGPLNKTGLFLISVLFYVCDLICVLIWCPFRLLMRTRCCTTCRIFNWDHFMMFSPMVFMGGFFGLSLFICALIAWLVWEVCILLYPERFWEQSNAALKCSECTDKLCTQYCQRLRK